MLLSTVLGLALVLCDVTAGNVRGARRGSDYVSNVLLTNYSGSGGGVYSTMPTIEEPGDCETRLSLARGECNTRIAELDTEHEQTLRVLDEEICSQRQEFDFHIRELERMLVNCSALVELAHQAAKTEIVRCETNCSGQIQYNEFVCKHEKKDLLAKCYAGNGAKCNEEVKLRVQVEVLKKEKERCLMQTTQLMERNELLKKDKANAIEKIEEASKEKEEMLKVTERLQLEKQQCVSKIIRVESEVRADQEAKKMCRLEKENLSAHLEVLTKEKDETQKKAEEVQRNADIKAKEVETETEKLRTLVTETQAKLKKAESKLQELAIKLQETEGKLQSTETDLISTKNKLQLTETKLSASEVKIKETEEKLQTEENKRQTVEKELESTKTRLNTEIALKTSAEVELKQCKDRLNAPPTKGPSSFYVHHHRDSNWSEAWGACKNRGMNLVTIRSQAVNSILQNLIITASGDFWIGLNDGNQEGTFSWTATGEVLSGYSSWLAGEPNNAGVNRNEDCVAFNNLGQWNDDECATKKGYICE